MASECGFTDGHYKSLIRLRNVLSLSAKFEVLAFPCNQFGGQEPAVSGTGENTYTIRNYVMDGHILS